MEENGKEHEWPLLVDESRDLLCASILLYGTTDLREFARQGKISGNVLLTLPFTAQDVLDTVSNNRDKLKAIVGPETDKMYMSALDTLQEEEKDGKFAGIEIVSLADENSTSELVYQISVTAAMKRVTVAFRGSVTPRDFLVDCQGAFCNLDNPLDPASKEKMGIHHGFYEYLNGTNKSTSKHSTEAANKYTEIMTKLQPIFEKYPDYRLYTTGHSLGASLSLLFAVQAAASTSYSLPKPVTCVNFASPKVGNVHFRDCFQSLELDKQLRCIRFVNSGDIIPTLPDRQNWNLCRLVQCQSSVYRHCGPKIVLYPDGTFKVAHEKDDTITTWEFLQEVRYTFGHGLGFVMLLPTLIWYRNYFLENHGCGTYLGRFNREFAKSNLRLNHVYRQEFKTLKKKVDREGAGRNGTKR